MCAFYLLISYIYPCEAEPLVFNIIIVFTLKTIDQFNIVKRILNSSLSKTNTFLIKQAVGS